MDRGEENEETESGSSPLSHRGHHASIGARIRHAQQTAYARMRKSRARAASEPPFSTMGLKGRGRDDTRDANTGDQRTTGVNTEKKASRRAGHHHHISQCRKQTFPQGGGQRRIRKEAVKREIGNRNRGNTGAKEQ